MQKECSIDVDVANLILEQPFQVTSYEQQSLGVIGIKHL